MLRRADRGVALLAVTMAVAVLSAVGVELAITAMTGDRLASNALAIVQAEALARSGIAAARATLVEASHVNVPETLHTPWLRALDPQPLGDGLVRVSVEDEARRLDPNTSPEALPRLLAKLGVDPLLADAVLDWIDADDVARPHGAERRWYEAERPSRAPANRPLRSVGELLLVRGLDAPLLDRLRPFLTTAGEDGVNPNTAPADVLVATWPDAGRVAEILAARERGPVDCDDLPSCTTRSTAYTIRAVAAVGPVTRTLEVLVRVVPGVDAMITGWRWVPAS